MTAPVGLWGEAGQTGAALGQEEKLDRWRMVAVLQALRIVEIYVVPKPEVLCFYMCCSRVFGGGNGG